MSTSIIGSIVTGGTNSHATVAEEANAYATDFVTQGVLGTITNTTGIAPTTGSFGVNQDTGSDMAISILGTGNTTNGQSIGYVTVAPSSQDTQVLRARMASNYTGYVINANSSGSTKYDWIYLVANATNANTPDSAADNVFSFVTSRSTSNTADNGSPPTFGILLAIVTVANGATAITNANITDKRTQLVFTASGTLSTASLSNPYKFSVFRNSAWTDGNGAFTLITFDTETYDTGTNYSTSTGKFTAPAAGTYHFTAGLNVPVSNGSLHIIALYKNGTEVIRGVQGTASSTGGLQDIISGDVKLALNDYIQVFHQGSGGTGNAGAALTYFSGFLISAT